MKKCFKQFDIDSRVAIIKQVAFDYFIQYWEAQDLLTKLDPVMKIHNNGFISFNNVEDQNEFYFLSKSFNNN